jgi:MarR family transcriptional regulator, transcriptional regulator for hemolysin
VRTIEAGDVTVANARGVIDDLCGEVLGVLTEDQRAVFLAALVRLVGRDGPLSAVEPNPHAPHRRRSAGPSGTV